MLGNVCQIVLRAHSNTKGKLCLRTLFWLRLPKLRDLMSVHFLWWCVSMIGSFEIPSLNHAFLSIDPGLSKSHKMHFIFSMHQRKDGIKRDSATIQHSDILF